MQMFDKAESEFRELSDKRSIVENDKSKIQKVSCPLGTLIWCDSPGPALVEMERLDGSALSCKQDHARSGCLRPM